MNYIFFIIVLIFANCVEKSPKLYPFFGNRLFQNSDSFSYSDTSVNYQVCVPIKENEPISKENGSSYSISPELPSGLLLNPATGVISGTPMAVSPGTNYTIQAKNTNGTSETILSITVSGFPNNTCNDTIKQEITVPTLIYNGTPYTFLQGEEISTIIPTFSETITNCTSNPGIPSGLTLLSNCEISGIPTSIFSATTFAITASYATGSSTASITITVVADICSMTRDQVIQPSNWTALQYYLQKQAALGSHGTETADITTISGLGTGTKWSGSVLAPNGKIYGIPYEKINTMVVNPSNDTITFFGFLAGIGKWVGGVLAPNGKIYGIPHFSTSVLAINPNNSTTSTFGSWVGNTKWLGGVLAPNGKIYGIPHYATSVLVIDPNTDTTSTFGSFSGTGNWAGGVLAPNGKIYGIPCDSTSVLTIDPNTNTTSTFGSFVSGCKWVGGVLAPNAKIYATPGGSQKVLVIDPATNTVSEFGHLGTAAGGGWISSVLAPNGKIYAIPWYSTYVLIIDPATNTVDTTTITGLTGSGKWRSATLAPNGKIYAFPHASTSVLIIDTKSNGNWCDPVLQSAYFNKF